MTVTNNSCPDCKKSYDKKPTRCACGWYLINEKKLNTNKFICHFVEFGKRCESTSSVALSPRDDKWFCGPHAERVRDDRYKKLTGENDDEE